jgi:hypothetical protein
MILEKRKPVGRSGIRTRDNLSRVLVTAPTSLSLFLLRHPLAMSNAYLKLKNYHLNAQFIYLSIYLVLPYMFRAIFKPIFRGYLQISQTF